MYGLKPVPFIQSSFSAACKAQLSFQPFAAPFDSAQGRLEAGPCLQSNKFQRLQTSMQITDDGVQLPFLGLSNCSGYRLLFFTAYMAASAALSRLSLVVPFSG